MDDRHRSIQAALLAWGEQVRRDLPWRRVRDPWAILVSEVMLQQTQVARVIPKWEAFLVDFPTPAACAHAPLGAVIAAWQGLGYNRRARNLHAAAVAVVDRFDGELPSDLAGLSSLPGIGPYTARAVLAFAHEADVGVVDTNAARFLARAVAGRRLTASAAQGLADDLVPPGGGWGWNQAVLDLGAMRCTSRNPDCDACPLRGLCAWRLDGMPADPALGSAGTSGRQSTFAGSDRQGRGRLVAALTLGPVTRDELPAAMGWDGDPPRAHRVAATVVADGLAMWDDDVLVLPD